MRAAAVLTLALFLFAGSAEAAKKKPKKHRVPKPPPAFTVTPSDDIEQRVEAESVKATEILHALSSENLFESPYLAASVYYHDGFLNDFPDEKPEADPARRIVSRIGRTLNAERKAAFVALLLQYWCENASDADAPPPEFVVPIPYERPAPEPPPSKKKRKRSRRARPRQNHDSALDLFTDEGTPIRSATRGVVLLADKEWVEGEAFSTTSQRGGNSVIVFDPDANRFLRYAHLQDVSVSAGDLVGAGDRIGTVGHTGFNASRPKHGRHLHFEINEFNAGQVRPLKAAELWSVVRAQRPRGETP